MKFRYVMTGSFQSECYGNAYPWLMIEVPVPRVHGTKEDAANDSHFACRFEFSPTHGEVVLSFYPEEKLKPAEPAEDGTPAFYRWVEGDPWYHMTYSEFKALGGIVWVRPSSMEVGGSCDWSGEADTLAEFWRLEEWAPPEGQNIQDMAIDTTFNELFPSLTVDEEPEDIIGQAYHIAEVP